MVSVGGICPLMTLKGPSLLVIFLRLIKVSTLNCYECVVYLTVNKISRLTQWS